MGFTINKMIKFLNKYKTQLGLTLLEALMSTAIVGIGFVAVFNMVNFSVQSIDTSGERTKANYLVSMIAEDIIGHKDTIYGESTDGIGLINDLKNNGISVSGRSILLIGSGGTTKSILPSIIDLNPKSITLTNRTKKNALSLRDSFLHLFPIDCVSGDEIDRNYDLVINTTSSQLSNTLPMVDPVSVNGADTYDVNYAWQQTLFQSWCGENGSRSAIQGWGMLVEQAAESFSIWRGVRPETESIIQRLQSEVEN